MNYFRAFLTSHTHSLFLPKKWRDEIQRSVRQHQQGAGRDPESAPFGRQLDFWALAFATAVARDIPPIESRPSQGGHKFADTRSVELSDDLCELLAVVALGALGADDEGVGDPARVIELANQYAAAGCEEILRQLRPGDLRLSTLDKAINFATELVRGAEEAEA